MELTLRGYGIRVKVLREQVEEKTSRVAKQVYPRRLSGLRVDAQRSVCKRPALATWVPSGSLVKPW